MPSEQDATPMQLVVETSLLTTEADSPRNLKIEFVTGDATPEEITFNEWASETNKVIFNVKDNIVYAIRPGGSETNVDDVMSIEGDRISDLVGNEDRSGLINVALAGIVPEFRNWGDRYPDLRSQNEYKKRFDEKLKKEYRVKNPPRTLNTGKIARDILGLNKKQPEGSTPKVITPEAILKNIAKRRSQAENATPLKTLSIESIFAKLSPSSEKRKEMARAGADYAKIAGETADTLLQKATILIDSIPENHLTKALMAINYLGYNFNDVRSLVQGLNDLNEARKSDARKVVAIRGILTIIGAFTPATDSAKIRGALTQVFPTKKS